MSRSHPPTLITLAKRTLQKECTIRPGDHVLVAVSGGGDSLALLHVLHHLRSRLGITVTAHGVDHGLRPEAGDELELARELAERCEIPFATTRLELKAGGNLQARARDARFAALRHAAGQAGAQLIATAHHADDRAETVLLRLARGAGLRGLAVLQPRQGDLVRPLIRARKSAILSHLERHRVAYASDPSNEDRRFARVRARLDVLPTLETLSPRIVERLCELADQLADKAPEVVVLNHGEPLNLGRAQQEALRELLTRRIPSGCVRLPEGREVSVERGSRIVRVSEAAPGDVARRRGGLPNQ